MRGQVQASASQLREFEALCRAQGLPLTIQRRTILEAICQRHDHPTADQIFEAVQRRIPDISRTTVYRVLETLVKAGAVGKVCHPGSAARFDPKTHQHHHLVCLECGRIVDLEDVRLDALRVPSVDWRGFDIRAFDIQFRGTCPQCRRRRGAGAAARRRPARRARTASPKTRRNNS